MSHHAFNPEHLALTRREFLDRCGMGMGALAMAPLLASQASTGGKFPGGESFAAQGTPVPGRKRVIHIFRTAAPPVDTFDPKPALDRWHGKEIPVHFATERKTGAAYRSPFQFRKYGESGMEISELF